jgi:hypothetical protein
MRLPAVPAACADLDLAQVSRVLAKHYGDIPAAARELLIAIPDLRRLTWARPRLLEEAELERTWLAVIYWLQLGAGVATSLRRSRSPFVLSLAWARAECVYAAAAGSLTFSTIFVSSSRSGPLQSAHTTKMR